jgi:hypothetical protein
MERQKSMSRMDPVRSAGFSSQVSTAGLPNGVPEHQLKDAKDDHVGHFQSAKRTIFS